MKRAKRGKQSAWSFCLCVSLRRCCIGVLVALVGFSLLANYWALTRTDGHFLPAFLRGPGHGRAVKGGRPSLDGLSNSTAVPLLAPVGKATPIKILISSFQDGERCANTLYRALAKAKHSDRISFSVVQAVGPKDVVCLNEFRKTGVPKLCGPPSKEESRNCQEELLAKIHFKMIPLTEGKGPVHQRGLLSEFADLSGDAAMCLAIDAHMDFANGWDKDLLEDWARTGNEFAVLTSYPAQAAERVWPETCGYFITKEGIPRGATMVPHAAGKKPGKPQLTMNWAAGQSLARCHAEKNVPADKTLTWMFDGEEVNRAVRFWTHGYDLYNPKVTVVLHNYSGAHQAFWSHGPPEMWKKRRENENRLKTLLGGEAPKAAYGKYGLGAQRSLEQYVTWAHTNLGGKWGKYLTSKGITPHFNDFVHKEGVRQPNSLANFCSKLQRPPVKDVKALVNSAGVSL